MEKKISASKIQREGLKDIYKNIDKYQTFIISNQRSNLLLYISKYKNTLGQEIQAIRKVKEELQKIGVKHMNIFGSLATGKATDKSDIDISFTTKEIKGAFNSIEIINKVKEILNNDTYDVHYYNFLKKAIRDSIDKEGINVF